VSQVKFSELKENAPKRVEVDGVPVCLVRQGEKVFAVNDTCSHSDASLSEGDVRGNKIECWLHGAEFDLTTGEAVTGPAVDPIATYPVEVVDDLVEVKVS
jgi:3-phenylpropionate/trans-cinnamate dioxygenase ferredoxin component